MTLTNFLKIAPVVGLGLSLAGCDTDPVDDDDNDTTTEIPYAKSDLEVYCDGAAKVDCGAYDACFEAVEGDSLTCGVNVPDNFEGSITPSAQDLQDMSYNDNKIEINLGMNDSTYSINEEGDVIDYEGREPLALFSVDDPHLGSFNLIAKIDTLLDNEAPGADTEQRDYSWTVGQEGEFDLLSLFGVSDREDSIYCNEGNNPCNDLTCDVALPLGFTQDGCVVSGLTTSLGLKEMPFRVYDPQGDSTNELLLSLNVEGNAVLPLDVKQFFDSGEVLKDGNGNYLPAQIGLVCEDDPNILFDVEDNEGQVNVQIVSPVIAGGEDLECLLTVDDESDDMDRGDFIGVQRAITITAGVNGEQAIYLPADVEFDANAQAYSDATNLMGYFLDRQDILRTLHSVQNNGDFISMPFGAIKTKVIEGDGVRYNDSLARLNSVSFNLPGFTSLFEDIGVDVGEGIVVDEDSSSIMERTVDQGTGNIHAEVSLSNSYSIDQVDDELFLAALGVYPCADEGVDEGWSPYWESDDMSNGTGDYAHLGKMFVGLSQFLPDRNIANICLDSNCSDYSDGPKE